MKTTGIFLLIMLIGSCLMQQNTQVAPNKCDHVQHSHILYDGDFWPTAGPKLISRNMVTDTLRVRVIIFDTTVVK